MAKGRIITIENIGDDDRYRELMSILQEAGMVGLKQSEIRKRLSKKVTPATLYDKLRRALELGVIERYRDNGKNVWRYRFTAVLERKMAIELVEKAKGLSHFQLKRNQCYCNVIKLEETRIIIVCPNHEEMLREEGLVE